MYVIDGNNYFKLEDLSKTIGFYVEYDNVEQAYVINSGVPVFVAVPTVSTILVNGEESVFDAYSIGDSNYFKLRDLAYVLNGTEKQFEINWDSETNSILLRSGQPYTER